MTGKEFDLTTALQILGIVAAVAAAFIFHGDVLPWLRRFMSHRRARVAAADQSANRSIDQSAPINLSAQLASGLGPGDDPDLADMDAADAGLNWQLPPISRYLSDDEFIVFLASQRLPGGKYRLSANRIVQTAGGDRTHVLAIVRQVREGVPQYPAALTPEQAELRKELALE